MGVFARLLGRSKAAPEAAPEASDAAARTGLEPDGAEAEPKGRAEAARTGGAQAEGADAEGADTEGADAEGADATGAGTAEARDAGVTEAVTATGALTAVDAGDAAGDRREAVTARPGAGADGASEGTGIPRQQSAGEVADSAAGEGARR